MAEENRRLPSGPIRLACVLLLTGLLLPANSAIAQVGAEAPAPDAEVEPPPRGNAEFIGVTSTSTVTRQFEMYNPHSRQALQALKDMGFTQVILDWPNLHPVATEIGLDIVLANWWTDKTAPEEIERAISIARDVDRSRLAGISMMDEPERNSPETPFDFYIDLYDRLRARLDNELPGVRLEISHWGPLAGWDHRYYDYFSFLYEAADVMRIMPFPDLHEGPLGEVYLMMQRSRAVMEIAGRDLPLIVILQTWVLPPESKLPELAELRVMAWQALLGGAETISFFDYNTEIWGETPGFHDGFVELMHELTTASARLAGATIESSLNAEGILSAKVTWPTGCIRHILINTNRKDTAGLDALAVVEMSPAPCAAAAGTPRKIVRCCPPVEKCSRRMRRRTCRPDGVFRVPPRLIGPRHGGH